MKDSIYKSWLLIWNFHCAIEKNAKSTQNTWKLVEGILSYSKDSYVAVLYLLLQPISI